MKIGTTISKFVTPIAGAFGADCYDPVTRDLKPESPCGNARTGLDNARTLKDFGQVIFDRFWSNSTKGDKMADTVEKGNYILVVLVEADDAVEAVAKKNEGKVLAVNPQQAKPQVQFGGGQPGATGVGQVITRGLNKPIGQTG